MKRWLLIILCAMAIAALLAWSTTADPGYVRITIGHTLIETTFWVALFGMIGLWWLMTWLLASTRFGLRHGHRIWSWISGGGDRRARRLTSQGLLAWVEGDWQRAARLLARSAPHADAPLVNYLTAARASHAMNKRDDALKLLEQAVEIAGAAHPAITATHAEICLQEGDAAGALARLRPLREQAASHPQVLRLLAQAAEGAADWALLRDLLPDLRRQGILADDQLLGMERKVWCHRIQEATQELRHQPGPRDLGPLMQLWDALPGTMRRDEPVIGLYAEALAQLDDEAQAETLLRKVLRNHWSEALVGIYGRLRGADLNDQLLAAEQWLSQHPESPALLLALGRLCLRNSLWGKARDYFEASVKLGRNPENIAELARLLGRLGQHERSAAMLMSATPTALPALPLP